MVVLFFFGVFPCRTILWRKKYEDSLSQLKWFSIIAKRITEVYIGVEISKNVMKISMKRLRKCIIPQEIFTFVSVILFLFPVSSAFSSDLGGPISRHVYRTWSHWAPWTACSRTCGGSVRMRSRTCRMRLVAYITNLPRICLGDTEQYDLCPTKACPESSGNFLAYQCSMKDQKLKEMKVEWLPYMNVKTPCELQCFSQQFLTKRFGKVVDGTRCISSDRDDNAVCVNGRCTTIDCSGKLGGDNRRDICGTCRGDNSSCVHYRNTYWSRPRKAPRESDSHYNYDIVAEIPAGASRILVTEHSYSNFIALMDKRGRFVLNGGFKVDSPGRFRLSDKVDISYNRTSEGRDTVFVTGPIDIGILVLIMGRNSLPTVDYEYWIPSDQQNHSAKRYYKSYSFEDKALLVSKHPILKNDPNKLLSRNQKLSTHRVRGYNSYYHRNSIITFEGNVEHRSFLKQNFTSHPTVHLITSTTPKSTSELIFEDKHRYELDTRASKLQTDIGIGLRSDALMSNSMQPANWSRRQRSNVTMALSSKQKPTSPVISRSIVATGDVLTKLPESARDRLRDVEVAKRKHDSPEAHRSFSEMKKRFKRKKRREETARDFSTCSRCVRVKNQKKQFCLSDFVLRAIVQSTETIGSEQRHEIEIIQSYKNKMNILNKEYIWVPDGCRCPKLHSGKEYLLMGRFSSTKRESRLTVDKDSFVRRYNRKRSRAMQLIVRDQISICKLFV